MTWQDREEIFAKEVLTIDDMQKLLNCGYEKARETILLIKSKSDRLKISGICHIQDYIDCFGLNIDRFLMPKKERKYEV